MWLELEVLFCASHKCISVPRFRPRDNGPEGMEPDGVIEVTEDWQIPVGYLMAATCSLPSPSSWTKIKVYMFKWSLTDLSSLNYRATGRRWWTALMTWTCTSLFSGESMPMVLRNPLPFNRGLSSLASRVSYGCLLVLIEYPWDTCSLHLLSKI